MGFHHVLQRLRGVLDAENLPPGQRGLGTRRIIEARDLAELLHHFDRLDAEARLGYPPHIEQLADAAEAALAELHGSESGRNLAFALSLARPKKLKPNAAFAALVADHIEDVRGMVPLTEPELDDLLPINDSMTRKESQRWTARAVERHHGIAPK
jgi:hypothetical protein